MGPLTASEGPSFREAGGLSQVWGGDRAGSRGDRVPRHQWERPLDREIRRS